ncbi:MAG: hypothetical protein ACRD2J_13725 [Thermoanaerobaculia bacterium]
MRIASLLLALPLAATLACGGVEEERAVDATAAEAPAPPPSPEDARELIAYSAAFGDYRFSTESSFSLPLDASRFNEPARQGAEDLEVAGWIDIRDGRVVLAKGEGDRRFLVRPNGFVDIVPLAKKEMLEVTSVSPVDGKVEVDFTWRWIPNDVGASFTRGLVKERFDAMRHATATLQDFGSGWEVLIISEREAGVEDAQSPPG